MIDVRQIYVEVFKAIRNDLSLLELLEIETAGADDNEITARTRKQVLDTIRPEDMLTNYSTRLCITEERSNQVNIDEVGYIRIDILITQDKNKIDRRLLKIVKRLIEVLDTKERLKIGKNQLPVGLYGLYISRRVPRDNSSSTGWDKYSLVFEYKYITI